MAKPTSLGDTSMSWGACGDLKRKFCMMFVRKRKSSILASPSPKQYRFPKEKRQRKVNPVFDNNKSLAAFSMGGSAETFKESSNPQAPVVLVFEVG